MKSIHSKKPLRAIALAVGVSGLLAGGSVLANHSVGNVPEPKLEIFANQLPILIGRGQPKSLTLTGAVYDGDILFGGRVVIAPKQTQQISCPIFKNGDNRGVAVTRNSTNVPFRLDVLTPSNHPLGVFTCTLRYAATQVNSSTRETVPVPTIGNEVRFTYTVKRRFIF